MKNSNDTNGNQTRDLPTCSVVPQQTAPPRAPLLHVIRIKNKETYPENILRYILSPSLYDPTILCTVCAKGQRRNCILKFCLQIL